MTAAPIRVSPAPGVSIVHGNRMTALPPGLSHRDGGIVFRHLFEGEGDEEDSQDESDKPDSNQTRSDRANNYILSLATQHAFQSPVHHHNFEQFRYAIKGDVSLGPGAVIHQDELAFTGEGVYYGPQGDDDNERVILNLQYGGCSGQGYTSHKPLRHANVELQKSGSFQQGKYLSSTPGAHPVDGYQALWEHANAPAKLIYPAPQYDKSMIIKPRNFSWVSVQSVAGNVFRRHLGTFTEREVRVQQWRLEPGAEMVLPKVGGYAGEEVEAEQLLFVLRGNGKVLGEVVEGESAVRVRMGALVARDGVRIVAEGDEDVDGRGQGEEEAEKGKEEEEEEEEEEEKEDGAMVLLHWILPRV